MLCFPSIKRTFPNTVLDQKQSNQIQNARPIQSNSNKSDRGSNDTQILLLRGLGILYKKWKTPILPRGNRTTISFQSWHVPIFLISSVLFCSALECIENSNLHHTLHSSLCILIDLCMCDQKNHFSFYLPYR